MSRNDQSINSSFIALLAQSATSSNSASSSSSSPSQSGGLSSTASSTTSPGLTTIPNPFIGNLSTTAQEKLKETLNRSPF